MPGANGDQTVIDQATVRACIKEQRCPWCGRAGLRSLANHTVRAHQIYADELRDLAGLPAYRPLCAPELSERHRELALEQEAVQWLQQPNAIAAAAASREANYDDEQRRRRVEHLQSVRADAIDALRRRVREEQQDPELRALRRRARSRGKRADRPGAECPICGGWFCSVLPAGQDYRQRKYCSAACRSEAYRRLRKRTSVRRHEQQQPRAAAAP